MPIPQTWYGASTMARSSLGATLVALASLLGAVSGPASAAAPTWFDLPTARLPAAGDRGRTGRDDLGGEPRRRRDRARRARRLACRRSASSSGSDPYDIVRGPDGAMWFTEHNGNRIGRLTIDGELSEFYLRDLSTPTGITVGPDGALWFAQRGVSAIGRITVDGEITEWPTITPRAAPLSITTGSDGALWFTLTAANALGRITVDGTMTEFPLPANASGPQWITTGPDGALWFTARASNTIVRRAMGGGITTYPVPSPASRRERDHGRPRRRPVVHRGDGGRGRADQPCRARSSSSPSARVPRPPASRRAPTARSGSTPRGRTAWVGSSRRPAPTRRHRPSVTIVSPANGSVLTDGEGMLADYFCTDEAGGSGVASCDGPVADGAIVPNGPGAHTFTVTGKDVAGNTGSATHSYIVFEDISGPITSQSVFNAGRVIPIILELGGRPQGSVFASGFPLVRAVDCATGEATGPDQPANVQANLNTNNGRLMLQWRTVAGWAGTCRSLVVRFGLNGWSGADAVFTLRFA